METANKLQNVLVMTHHLYMQLHLVHWNVTGSDFYQLHDMFGDMYDEVFNAIDPIAENIRKLDKFVKFSPSDVSQSTLIDIKQDTGNIREDVLGTIIANNSLVISAISSALESAKIERLFDIENFLAERLSAHNKHAWMLKSLEK